MARIRTIKPEFWKHEVLSALPEATHILAAALLNYADDYGYFNANAGLIRAECSPLREPSVSIPESLRSLQEVDYIRLGSHNGKRYGRVVAFEDHQKVSHPAKSKIQDKPIVWDDSGNPPENIQKPPEPLRPEQGTGNREQGMEQGTGSEEERAECAPRVPVPIATASEPEVPELPTFLRRSRGSRWPEDRTVPDDWLQAAGMKRVELGLPAIDLRYEAERFRNYWAAKAGAGATRVEWRLTWMNWATDKGKTGDGQRNGKQSAHDKFLAGGAAFLAKLDEREGRTSGESAGD